MGKAADFAGRAGPTVSTSADESRHALGAPGRLYCGRRIKDRMTGALTRVTCADCKAALRADGVIR